MPYEFPPHVDALVKKQLEAGNYQSEDDVLLAALQSLETVQDDWSAVRKAIAGLDQGEKGLSLEQAFAAVRRKHGIPAEV